MSRVYTDDDGDEFPGQSALLAANMRRALKGKRGQAVLRELQTALEALPTKRLLADVAMARDTPDVCAFGALALYRGRPAEELRCEDFDYEGEFEAYVTSTLGVPAMIAWRVIYENDEQGSWRDETPEQRYDRMLAWVRSLQPLPPAVEPADADA